MQIKTKPMKIKGEEIQERNKGNSQGDVSLKPPIQSKSSLSIFNERLNTGNLINTNPFGEETIDRVNQISNIGEPNFLEILLRSENKTLFEILRSIQNSNEIQRDVGEKQTEQLGENNRNQKQLIDFGTQSHDILEMTRNYIEELLPHIKETKKYTQINSIVLYKILDIIKQQKLRSQLGLFSDQQTLEDESGGASFSRLSPDGTGTGHSGSNIGSGGGGLVKALELGLLGYGGVKIYKALRGRSTTPLIPKEETPKVEVLKEKPLTIGPKKPSLGGPKPPSLGGPKPQSLGGPKTPLLEGPETPPLLEGPKPPSLGGPKTPLLEGPEINVPKGLGAPVAEETGSIAAQAMGKLAVPLVGGLITHELDRDDTIGSWMDDHFGWASDLDAWTNKITNGLIGLSKEQQTALVTKKEQQAVKSKEKEKEIHQDYFGQFEEEHGGKLPPMTNLDKMEKPKENQTSVFAEPIELHGGTYEPWSRSSGEIATPLNVKPPPIPSANQMEREGPIAPFTPSKTFQEKSPQIIGRLKDDFGLTDVQAAGIVGNLGHESRGFKDLQEINPIGGGAGGYGWAQWTGTRRTDFLNWAKVNNLDPSSDEANYGFLKHELTNNYKGSIDAVKQTKNIGDATSAFEETYEKAGVVAMGSRLKYASAALQSQNQEQLTPTKIPTGNILTTQAQEKQKIEEAHNQTQPPIIINSPQNTVNPSPNQQKGPMPTVRNDDPVLLTALRHDLAVAT